MGLTVAHLRAGDKGQEAADHTGHAGALSNCTCYRSRILCTLAGVTAKFVRSPATLAVANLAWSKCFSLTFCLCECGLGGGV